MKAARRLLWIVLVLSPVLLIMTPALFRRALAATFTAAKVTISDSRAAQTNVTYAFSLGTPSANAISKIDIYFCTNANPNDACTPAGIDTDPGDDGIPITANTIDGSSETAAQISGDNHTISIAVGSTAPQTSDPLTFTFTGITNESTINTTNYVRITTYDGAVETDTAIAAIAVLATGSIEVTADVESIFDFTVTHVDTGGEADVNDTDLTVSATDDTIPFGTLTADTPSVAAHDINIKSNATGGYKVTVQADTANPLIDGVNHIDPYPGSNAVPTSWTGPAGTAKNDNTGYFGYTTEDILLEGDDDRFDPNLWAGTTTSPEEVMYNVGAPGSGAGDTVRVGWQIEVDTYQPPGSYAGSVVLIATPTY